MNMEQRARYMEEIQKLTLLAPDVTSEKIAPVPGSQPRFFLI